MVAKKKIRPNSKSGQYNFLLISFNVAKWNLGDVKIETMLVRVQQGVPCGCLLVYWTSTLLALHTENVLLPNSGMFRNGEDSANCTSVTVPLVVDLFRVAMDTIFCHDNYLIPTPPTLRHQSPGSSLADELNVSYLSPLNYSTWP